MGARTGLQQCFSIGVNLVLLVDFVQDVDRVWVHYRARRCGGNVSSENEVTSAWESLVVRDIVQTEV